MVNYKLGKIYKIVNGELVYFGSTCNDLRKRFFCHKSKALSGKGNSSKKLFENEGAKIILVEKFPCNDKMELLKRERYYIENFNCVNKEVPSRTKKEYDYDYYIKNTEIIKDKKRKHWEKTKDIKNEKRREKITCLICNKTFNKSSKAFHEKTKYHLSNIT